MLDGKTLTRIAVAGAVGFVVVPIVLPTLIRLSRPVAKSAIKTGIHLYQSAREQSAEFLEGLDDLMHEALAEVEAERTAGTGEGEAEASLAEGA